MIIRDATPADADIVRSIVRDALAEFGLELESTGTDADLDEVPLSYVRRGGVFRVIEYMPTDGGYLHSA